MKHPHPPRRHFLAINSILWIVLGALTCSMAQAQGGLDVVNTTANNVLNVLTGIGVVIVAIAIFIAAALLIFRAASFAVAGGIVVGGALMGSAVEVATWLVG